MQLNVTFVRVIVAVLYSCDFLSIPVKVFLSNVLLFS